MEMPQSSTAWDPTRLTTTPEATRPPDEAEELEDTLVCSECDASVPDTEAVYLKHQGPEGYHFVLCPACVAASDERYAAETARPNLFQGFLLGLILALLGGFIWYWILVTTRWQLGPIAVGLGYLAGYGAMRGAGDRRGPKVQAVAMGATFITMLFSQYLLGHYFVSHWLQEEGQPALPMVSDPITMLVITVLSLADWVTLIFWGLAFLFAYSVPRARRLARL